MIRFITKFHVSKNHSSLPLFLALTPQPLLGAHHITIYLSCVAVDSPPPVPHPGGPPAIRYNYIPQSAL